MEAPPIVCTLTDAEMRQRRAGLLAQVRAQVVAVRRLAEVGEGIELRFERDDATLEMLLELVRLESRCCAFLYFHLVVEPTGGELRLEITGPTGSSELLVAELSPP